MLTRTFALIALAAGLFATQPASAVVFDPGPGLPAHFDIDETIDGLVIDVAGYAFDPLVLGTYFMNEEPPFTTFGSDSITISNDPGTGFGKISIVSADLPRAQTTCNGAVDESQPGQIGDQPVPAGHCILDLPLLNSGGLDLGIDIFSPAGDLAGNPSFSDSVDIVVPEPASMAVLGFGLVALGAMRRRRG